MIETESFLLPLFLELRKQGVPLGISEYLLALKSIREGIGIEDIDRLERFLKLLWAKSQEDREIFHLKFTELVKLRLNKPIKISTETNEDKSSISNTNKPTTDDDGNNQSEKLTQRKDKTLTKKQQYNITINSSRELSSTINLSGEGRGQKAEYRRFLSPVSAVNTGSKGLKLPLNFYSVAPSQEGSKSPSDLSLMPSATLLLPSSTKTIYKKNPYNLIPRLPISQRDMTISWRNLRSLQREGIAEELDVQGTINDICKVGFFRHPVLQARRRNQVKLVLLIDSEGSMSPFNLLIKALQESIEKGGLLGNISTFYFHNCPEVYFYKKPNLTQTCPIEDVLSEQVKDNSVVIVSDAGAARRTYDGQRLKETKTFIKQLRQYTYLYAWLNPVPQPRWRTTTAEEIAEFVPMYPLDRQGLNDIVKILLGHPFPPEVRLDDQDD
jgi:uncharacterized protein with von Willebrand factor type A (vWA) domain